MRAETKIDDLERYALIGFRPYSRDLYFPEMPVKGEPSSVSRAVKGDMIWHAWEKYGVNKVVGDLHTHPSGGPFSTTDLYGFLNKFSGPKVFLKGLANEQENIFAFRTRHLKRGFQKCSLTTGLKRLVINTAKIAHT
jgi:hypothetical protein